MSREDGFSLSNVGGWGRLSRGPQRTRLKYGYQSLVGRRGGRRSEIMFTIEMFGNLETILP